jgi:carbon storage regulator CsrA
VLILVRKVCEKAIIDLRQWGLGTIEVMPAEIRDGKVRIGFNADPKIPVHREEVFKDIEAGRPMQRQ